MDNGAFDDDMESQRRPAPPRNMHQFMFHRACSVTVEEEQITFCWEDLTVKTQGSSKAPAKTLVDKATGFLEPGELVAIMGASGAGKSTLLNALTYRNTSDLNITGHRYVNGKEVSPSALTAVSAYVMQDDLFIGTLTPREHLDFMARVRMDPKVSVEKRRERVDDVMEELGLLKCQNTLIGIPGRIKGISGGEAKRLAFATEVLTNPPVLFCDEPTSGLDSYMAQSVIEVLRRLTRQGKSIICTIHQPSSHVFSLFDKVLLMAEGRLAFLGDIDRCYDFFTSCGHPCPRNFNPSDHYVHALAISPGREDHSRAEVRAITDAFVGSPEGREIRKTIQYQKENEQDHPTLSKNKRTSPYRAGCWAEFLALFCRAWLSTKKDPLLIGINFAQTIGTAILFGVVFLQQEYNQAGVQNINGAIFMTLAYISYAYLFSIMNVACLEVPIFLREHFNGTYRVWTYFLSKQLAELPLFLALPVIFSCIDYWMVGLSADLGRFFFFVLVIVVLTQVTISFAYFVSYVAPNVQAASTMAPPIIIFLMLFGGFFLNSSTIPGWLSWVQYVSWFHYSNEALTVNQWDGVRDITCGQAINVTLPPNACRFNSGDDVLDFYGMDPGNRAGDVVVLAFMFLLLRSAALLVLYARTFRKK